MTSCEAVLTGCKAVLIRRKAVLPGFRPLLPRAQRFHRVLCYVGVLHDLIEQGIRRDIFERPGLFKDGKRILRGPDIILTGKDRDD